MAFDRAEPYSLSGVPLVFDRFGLIGPFVADVTDPLEAARGVLFGMALALLIWTAIVALVV
ncbi:hypothetical protein [Sphingomonas sp. Leaf231]|uniref:hypothetical protein n=1 Tax=Sphingomonas sp. Leaf231 TaxID=1736301 RepID=UPI000AC70EEB|nr:hypothetical protein [Sphingomonas sp. Leaf231]